MNSELDQEPASVPAGARPLAATVWGALALATSIAVGGYLILGAQRRANPAPVPEPNVAEKAVASESLSGSRLGSPEVSPEGVVELRGVGAGLQEAPDLFPQAGTETSAVPNPTFLYSSKSVSIVLPLIEQPTTQVVVSPTFLYSSKFLSSDALLLSPGKQGDDVLAPVPSAPDVPPKDDASEGHQ
jgi:hypothetical protein